MRNLLVLFGCLVLSAGCASAPKPKPKPKPQPTGPPAGYIEIIKYEERTQQLLDATDQLTSLAGNLDEQRMRLERICVDYPDHIVCQPHTAAKYAREAFCSDSEFTRHVDAVVSACHQGQCKQVDEASLLTRKEYMVLIQRLPHTLVTFNAASARLDRTDEEQIQKFVEQIDATKGYIIIVGRASRDGPWDKNLQYALDRAEQTRKFIVEQMGMNDKRVGYITYGHEKMYLTGLDAERLTERKLSTKQANRSALLFTYPCYEEGP